MRQTPPPPPGWKPPTNRTHLSTEPEVPLPTPPVLVTPTIVTQSGKLSPNETEFILDNSLLPEHRDDPNVLRFIANYLRCRNATQAAREAGLNVVSGRNLRNRPDIYLAITKLSDKSVSKYGYDAAEMIEKVKEVADVDPADLERPDGTFIKHMSELRPELRRAIKKMKVKNFYETDANGIKVMAGEIIEVEFYDKLTAIEMLGGEKDIFKKTTIVEHGITAQMSDILLESKQRANTALKALNE